MYPFEELTTAIERYIEFHGNSPKVRIGKDFWEKYAHKISDLSNQGIDISVVENGYVRGFYFAHQPYKDPDAVDTLYDLKKQVDSLIEEGKGHWPVKFMPHDANIYLQIKLCPIIPEKAPVEGLELKKNFIHAPDGEHILVLYGQDRLD